MRGGMTYDNNINKKPYSFFNKIFTTNSILFHDLI